MDRLEQSIADKEAEITKLADELDKLMSRHDRLVIELAAMKEAAKLRPVGLQTKTKMGRVRIPLLTTAKKTANKRKGRQAGDISHEWRQVLRKMRQINKPAGYAEISEIAESLGIKTQMPNVRERVRAMADNNLLIGTKRGFLVTDRALERFGFMDEFLKKNETAAE